MKRLSRLQTIARQIDLNLDKFVYFGNGAHDQANGREGVL